tara:strand:+ start:491 stop:1693 length:1203 start_codon:yes stop_codon:yes gene_type:complete
MESPKNNIDKSSYNPNIFLFSELLILVCLFLIIYKWNPSDMAEKYPRLINLFWLLVVFFMTMGYIFIKLKNKSPIYELWSLKRLFTITSFISGIIICVTFFLLFLILGPMYLFPNMPNVWLYIGWVFFLLICVFTIASIYLLYKAFLSWDPDWPCTKFILKLILYIPCILINIIEYFKNQWAITTRTIWIVLGIEILLISLYFIIPWLLKIVIRLSYKNKIRLLKKPIYLNNVKTLGGFKEESDEDDIKYNYHYSLSAWFYINPQPPNTSKAYTKYTNILNFGNKPQIQFNSLKNTLRIQTELNNHKFVTIYSTKNIDYQKWHNIVINYDGGIMDIFLDGELVSSKPKIIPYMAHENLIFGANNGIHGGICNVVYSEKLLSKSNIMLNYKLLRSREIPVL